MDVGLHYLDKAPMGVRGCISDAPIPLFVYRKPLNREKELAEATHTTKEEKILLFTPRSWSYGAKYVDR